MPDGISTFHNRAVEGRFLPRLLSSFRSLFIQLMCPVVLTLLIQSSCTTPTVWGHSVSSFRSQVRQGVLPQLRLADASGLDLSELEFLGDGAAYFLSFHTFNDPVLLPALLEQEIRGGREPYALAATYRLMDLLLEDERYERAFVLAESLGDRYRVHYDFHRHRLEAAYWARHDAAAQRQLRELRAAFPRKSRDDAEPRAF